MSLNSTEQHIWEYIRGAYPQGIRNNAWDTGSITESYDQVRAVLFGAIDSAVESWVKQLSIQTCDENWIVLWEEFLWLPTNPASLLTERRARVISRLIGSHSTITNIRTVIESYLWAWPTSYKITEKWAISTNVDDVWTYIVSVYTKPTWYDETVMRDLLESVQPIHCVLLLETTPVILDALWLVDSIASFVHSTVNWLDWNSLPSTIPENQLWWDENVPLSWFIWA